MSTVKVKIQNDKNTGKDPNTSVTLSTGADAKDIGTLSFDPKPSTFPAIWATNITHDAQGVIVTFQVGSTNKVDIKAGEYKDIRPEAGGPAVNIAGCFLSARKA